VRGEGRRGRERKGRKVKRERKGREEKGGEGRRKGSPSSPLPGFVARVVLETGRPAERDTRCSNFLEHPQLGASTAGIVPLFRVGRGQRFFGDDF